MDRKRVEMLRHVSLDESLLRDKEDERMSEEEQRAAMVNYEEALKAPLVPLVPIFPTAPNPVPTNLTNQLINCPNQHCGQYVNIKLEMQSFFCHHCKGHFRREGAYWVPTTPEIAAAVQPSEKLPCPRCLQQLEIRVGVERFGCPKCNAIYKREGLRYVGQLDQKTGEPQQQQPGAYQQQQQQYQQGQQGQYLQQQQYQPQPQQQYQPQQYQQLLQQQYQPQPQQQYQQLMQPHAGHGANSSAAAQLLSGAMGGNWNYAQHPSADAQHSIVDVTGSAPPANSEYSTVNVPCSNMACQKQHTVTRGTSKFNCQNCNTESTIIKCSADNCKTLLTVDCRETDHFQCPSCNNEMYLDDASIAQWWQ
jgi:Zn-finger nucleic acid-binding protein